MLHISRNHDHAFGLWGRTIAGDGDPKDDTKFRKGAVLPGLIGNCADLTVPAHSSPDFSATESHLFYDPEQTDTVVQIKHYCGFDAWGEDEVRLNGNANTVRELLLYGQTRGSADGMCRRHVLTARGG